MTLKSSYYLILEAEYFAVQENVFKNSGSSLHANKVKTKVAKF